MASTDRPHPEEAQGAVSKDAPQPSSVPVTPPRLPAFFAARTPFFYGWAVLASLCCAGFARQGPAVSTLSVFVTPLIHDFGWSRTALSGAVSLGGILAAAISPRIGLFLDRAGSRLVLCYAMLTTGAALLLLSLTNSLVMFYLLFCFARMNWASPFELGIYGAVNNWFVVRRAVRDLGRDPGADGRAGDDADCRRAGDAALVVARRLAGDRRADPGGRLSADLALAGPPAGGSWAAPGRVSRRRQRHGAVATTPQPEPDFSRAQAMRTAGFLAAARLYGAGLPDPGGDQPAHGAASDRARHRPGHRRDDRQHLFADVGGREPRLRASCRDACRSAIRWRRPARV